MKRAQYPSKNRPGRLIVLCCLLFGACHLASAQVKFSASAPKSVPVNQAFQLTYTIENSSTDRINLGAMDDFQLLGGPSTSQNYSWVNGRSSQSVTYTYTLKPKKEGSFKIGRASANIEGTNMESNELNITVTGPVQQQAQRRRDPFDPFGFFDQDPFQQQQQDPRQQAQDEAANQKTLKENIFVSIVPDRTNVYVGERITATMRLYIHEGFGVANFGIEKSPSFDGFWSQEVQLPKEPKPREEIINGKKYKVVDVQVFNLYPQKSGELKVSPGEAEIIAQAPVGRDFFGRTQYQNFKMTSGTGSLTVNVKELPSAGKPADFSGAVGHFAYTAKLSSTEGKTDNAVTYSVKISGSGNLKTIDLPKPQLPDGFEVFDAKIKDDVTNSSAGMSGSKQYDYLIIPRQPGDYKVPSSAFSYFDPSSGRYVTLTAPEMALKVTGEPSQNPNSGGGVVASKEDISALHSDIRFIRTKTTALKRSDTHFFGSAAYVGLYTTPFLLFLGLIFVKRKNEDLAADLVGARRRRATKLAKKRLSAAEKHLAKSDKPAFYDEVSRAIWGYLGDKLSIDQSQLSKENVEEKLLAKNVRVDTIAHLKSLINTCELALYAPIGGGDEMRQNYNAAIALITDLEDEIK